jgi:alanine racemase
MLNQETLQNYASSNNLVIDNTLNHHNMINNIVDNEIAIDSSSNEMTKSIEEALLEEFKDNVKAWLDLDNQLKRLSAASKERRKKKNDINLRILEFMSKFDIEDLNTKDGIIRYRKTFVKEPLSQKTIKTKLEELFKDDTENFEKIAKIFTDREKIEKTSLRRLKL